MGEKTLRGQNSAYSCNGASNHSNLEREIKDFYATPSIATKTLVEYLDENYPDIKKNVIWEPACGKGHISEIFRKAGYRECVLRQDLSGRDRMIKTCL